MPTFHLKEGQAHAQYQKARADFYRLAEVAFTQQKAVETAQHKLATTQEALDKACIRKNQTKAVLDAVQAMSKAAELHGWQNT